VTERKARLFCNEKACDIEPALLVVQTKEQQQPENSGRSFSVGKYWK
jgi:hypothetical protein